MVDVSRSKLTQLRPQLVVDLGESNRVSTSQAAFNLAVSIDGHSDHLIAFNSAPSISISSMGEPGTAS